MANQNSKNFVDTVLDAQKNMVDTLVENTKKATNGNAFVNDTIEKGNEFYNKWVDQQKKSFNTANEKVETATETSKENANKANEYYQNWLNTQVNWAKQVWDMNQKWVKNNIPNQDNKNTTPADWFNTFNNAMGNYNNWMNQSNNIAEWWKNLQQFSPANASDNIKNATENWTKMFNTYYETLNTTFSELQKNMQNATTQDVYNNMINAMQGFGKFNEIWAPFWKSIQDKTFNADTFKKTFSAEAYKEMMDKFFGFMPENSRQYFQQATELWNGGMKNFGEYNKGVYNNAREIFANANPFATANIFETVLENYNKAQSTFQNAVSPIAKMIAPNQYTKNANEWADIANEAAIFNIKNAELQYMMYQQSTKVMDKLVDNIANKIENGVEINSINALYQEWLNIGDKVYVELFESDEYSKLMAEVSALQLKLRKQIDLQNEKMFANVPVATRSELDELYKVIYDLKKEVRQLEKMLDIETEDTATPAKSTRKTTTKK